MAERAFPIQPPFGGLVEAWSFSEQPENSAREFQNMRCIDHTNGRQRISQRAGQTKYLTSALKVAGTKVQDLITFTVDNRQVEYTAIASGSETVTWSEPSPSGENITNVKTDRQGNVYFIHGNAALAKFSADGNKIWELPIPVADDQHIVRALAVDSNDIIYLGVSAGATLAASVIGGGTGNQSTAKLWAYRQATDQAPEQLWEITTGAYTEEIVARDGKIYTAQNRPDRKKSHLRVYDFANTIAPELTKEWRIPFPANSVAVKPDGSVIVACEAIDDSSGGLKMRPPDPKFPDLQVDSIDWTPRQLTGSDRRIWSWYIGDSIDQTDVATDIADGVEALRWRDNTKNSRHFFAAIDEGSTGQTELDGGPKLILDCLLEHKGLRWDATGVVSPIQILKTLPSATTAKAFADNQRGMIPTYVDSSFALYMVLRPSPTTNQVIDTGVADNTRRWVFGQDRDNDSSGNTNHVLFINASDASGNTVPPTEVSGKVFWYTNTGGLSGGDGTGGTVRSGFYSTRQDGSTSNKALFTILTLVWDGGISGDTQQSLFQINGSPVDLFTSGVCRSVYPTYLGAYRVTKGGAYNPSSGVSGYLGDIVEILCLDRKDRNDASQNVLSYQALQFDSALTNQTIDENTAIVGYLAHKYGGWFNLPYSNAAVNNYPHPFGLTGSGQDRLAGPPRLNDSGSIVVNTAQALANKIWACVIKYSPDGKIIWTANEQELIGGVRSGGYGYAVAVNSDGNIYSVGPIRTGTGSHDSANIRMIVDQGDDFSIQVADGAWSVSLAGTVFSFSSHPRVDIDEFDNLYIPLDNTSGTNSGFRVYSKTGTLLHNFTFPVAQVGCFAVAADDRIPDYRDDLSTSRAEHVFVGKSSTSLSDDDVFKVRLVSSAQVSGAVRSLLSLGVSGGDIVKFTTSGVTTPTGGSGALDSTAKYVQSTTLFKRVFYTDGRQYKKYDPVDDEVTEWKCLSAGAIPSRCALVETWRGRIVLARSADEPHNWFLSKKDDPENWDFFPPTPTEIDAVAGNNSLAGLCPDIINSVVPYSEDILVFGCDHSIWMLVGDPAAGGRLELVSDITGMSFGRPWTKDPNGILYFIGSRGGLFRWVPGAKPERISLYKIERQLQEIDFSSFYVRLIWNYKDEGLHIFQCPFGAGGTQVSHWFWEQKTDSFAKDIFGTSTYTNVQPTAVAILDGDDFDDRLVLIGGEDGRVRKWDHDARSDDTRTDLTTKIPIDSYVTIFPIIPPSELAAGMETQFHGLTVVLGDREAGCRYELFSSDEPDSLGLARRHGTLGPGRNAPKWEKVVGAYCGLRLRNAAPEERWSLERAYLYAVPGGMVRPRAVN